MNKKYILFLIILLLIILAIFFVRIYPTSPGFTPPEFAKKWSEENKWVCKGFSFQLDSGATDGGATRLCIGLTSNLAEENK